jgi:hypothetical protein
MVEKMVSYGGRFLERASILLLWSTEDYAFIITHTVSARACACRSPLHSSYCPFGSVHVREVYRSSIPLPRSRRSLPHNR